jgi:hypothetical protein
MVCKSAEIGGPCRGRTYDPLIKSEAEGVAQVLDGLGNSLLSLSNSRRAYLSHLVPVHLTSARFVASANTVLTPGGKVFSRRVPRERPPGLVRQAGAYLGIPTTA